MSTTDDQLASVREAIASVESGVQEVTLADGRRVRYPDLQILYDREATLLARQAEEAITVDPNRIRISLGAGR